MAIGAGGRFAGRSISFAKEANNVNKRLTQAVLLMVAMLLPWGTALAVDGAFGREGGTGSIQASEYISSYNAGVSFSGGSITISFAVYGTGYMDTIGAQKIVLQKCHHTRWRELLGELAFA